RNAERRRVPLHGARRNRAVPRQNDPSIDALAGERRRKGSRHVAQTAHVSERKAFGRHEQNRAGFRHARLPYNARVENLADEIRKYGNPATIGRIAVLLFLGIAMEVAARVLVPRMTAKVSQRTSQFIDLERRQRGATVVKFSTSVVRLVLWSIVFVS